MLPDLNVTPLVDVVLVLLIIFMVVAPQLEPGEAVLLPTVVTPDADPKAKTDPITVSIGATSSIYLEKDRITVDDLIPRLAALRGAGPERRVVLKADASLPFDEVRKVFGAIQTSGFQGCSLVVSTKEESKGG